jgi:hypothetical protein
MSIESITPAKNIREENLRLGLIKAYADELAGFLKDARADLLDELLRRYEAEGTKSFAILLPNGQKVGQVTLPEAKAYDDITDAASLFEWAEPKDGLIVDVIPAQAERKEKRINKVWLDGILKSALETEGGQLIDPGTGEVIPGVRRHPATVKTSFTVTYTKTGREELAQAYLNGDLNAIADGSALPQIEHHKHAA